MLSKAGSTALNTHTYSNLVLSCNGILMCPQYSIQNAPPNTLHEHSSSVQALTTLADGTLVSGSYDNTINLWHPKTFERLHTLSRHSGPVLTLTTLADGTLVSGSGDCTIKLWHPITFKCLHTLNGHSDSVWALTALFRRHPRLGKYR